MATEEREPLIPSSSTDNRPSALRTLSRIAALSLEVTSNPHAHRHHPAALHLLRQAVEITRPWLEDVRAELEHHGHRQQHERGIAPANPGFRGQLLAELPNLIPLLLKFLTASKGRKEDPKRLGLLGTLHDVLERKIEEALREIGRMERRLSRAHGRRGRREVRERGRERESEEWYREERRGGLNESYYRGEGSGEGEGGQSGRGERDREREGHDNVRHRFHRHRRRRNSRTDTEHHHRSNAESESHDQVMHTSSRGSHLETQPRANNGSPQASNNTTRDEQRSNNPGPRPTDLSQMTPEQRLEAKKQTLARYKEMESQSKARAATNTPASSVSGTTESITQFPPPPVGAYAP